jgi:hypothetical protein
MYVVLLSVKLRLDRAPGEYRLGNRILVENWETRIIQIVPVV